MKSEDPQATESASSLADAWSDLERALVCAVLGEITVPEATERMKAALGKHLGVASSLLNGHHSLEATSGEHVLIGNVPDGTAMTLVLSRKAVFEGEQMARLRRLYEALIQTSHPLQRSATLLHTLRNRLTGLQANVEFAELMTADTQELEPSPQRDEILVALRHAMSACDDISKTLGSIEGLQRG